MKRLIVALVLASGLATSALAQADPDMDQALSMLEVAAQRELGSLGITDVDPMTLSLNQLSQIKSIMSSSDYNETEKARQIMQVVGRN